jgi:hypothetical protein
MCGPGSKVQVSHEAERARVKECLQSALEGVQGRPGRGRVTPRQESEGETLAMVVDINEAGSDEIG